MIARFWVKGVGLYQVNLEKRPVRSARVVALALARHHLGREVDVLVGGRGARGRPLLVARAWSWGLPETTRGPTVKKPCQETWQVGRVRTWLDASYLDQITYDGITRGILRTVRRRPANWSFLSVKDLMNMIQNQAAIRGAMRRGV